MRKKERGMVCSLMILIMRSWGIKSSQTNAEACKYSVSKARNKMHLRRMIRQASIFHNHSVLRIAVVRGQS